MEVIIILSLSVKHVAVSFSCAPAVVEMSPWFLSSANFEALLHQQGNQKYLSGAAACCWQLLCFCQLMVLFRSLYLAMMVTDILSWSLYDSLVFFLAMIWLTSCFDLYNTFCDLMDMLFSSLYVVFSVIWMMSRFALLCLASPKMRHSNGLILA